MNDFGRFNERKIVLTFGKDPPASPCLHFSAFFPEKNKRKSTTQTLAAFQNWGPHHAF